MTDPKGIVAQTYFDALGRQTKTIADYTSGTPTTSSNQTTTYTCDGDGNILTQTAVEPSGTPNQTTAYIYGTTSTSGVFSNTLLSKVEYPDATAGTASTSASSDVSYTYDALGEKTGMTDQNGNTHAYSYDSLGRQTLDSVTTLGSGVDGSARAIGTTYNPSGLPYRQTSYSNAAATTVVNQDQDTYNGLGQLTIEYQAVTGSVTTSTTPKVQYAYSSPSTGSVQNELVYPDGRTIEYVYNAGVDAAIGRVSLLLDLFGSAANFLQSYNYLGVGTIIGESNGDSVAETTTLDNFGRTSELKYAYSGASGTVDDFQYGYDQDGNALYQANAVNNTFSQIYSYDSLNRLTGYQRGTLNGSDTSITGTPTASQSYSYDALGNQSTVTTNGTATTNTANSKNELTASGSSTLAYDNDGNTLTDENGQTYTYDAWNRMVSAKNSSGATLATYSYDPSGRRITQAAGGPTTAIYFSNQGQDLEERNASGISRQYVWGLAYVNQLVERDDNRIHGNFGFMGSGLGERLYAQQNLNWSVSTLINNTGGSIPAERISYTPYGVATFLTASWAPTTDAYSNAVLFQGGQFDAATGQYKFQARDYDPRTGNWKEMDPIGTEGGINVYAIEGNSPVDNLDPRGLAPLPNWTGIPDSVLSQDPTSVEVAVQAEAYANEAYNRSAYFWDDWQSLLAGNNPAGEQAEGFIGTMGGDPQQIINGDKSENQMYYKEFKAWQQRYQYLITPNQTFKDWLNKHPNATYSSPNNLPVMSTAGDSGGSNAPNYVIQRPALQTALDAAQAAFTGNGGTGSKPLNPSLLPGDSDGYIPGGNSSEGYKPPVNDGAEGLGSAAASTAQGVAAGLNEMANGMNKLGIVVWQDGNCIGYYAPGVDKGTAEALIKKWLNTN